MNIKPRNVPLKAEWHRATTLLELSFSRNGLAMRVVEEDTEKEWHFRFREVQAFKCTAEESGAAVRGSLPLPVEGAFYEVTDSPWLRELGLGKLAYLSRAKHYVICCYDEIVEVVASDHAIEPA